MNERTDLDRLVGTWLRDQAPQAAPEDLLGSALAVTTASRPLPTWRALLSVPPMRTQSRVLVGSPAFRLARVVVALVILVGVIAGATVAGAGLLARPDPALTLGPCQPTLPEGVVARVDRDSQGTGTRALLSDGWFVTETFDPAVSQTMRRMTDAGVRLYLDAINQAAPIGDCRILHWRQFPNHSTVRLRAVVGGELVDTIYDGDVWSETLRRLDATERAAAADLVDRLEHPETWLPSSAWSEPEERPLEPSQAVALATVTEWQPQSNFGVEWPRGSDRAAPPATSQLGVEPCRLLEPTKIASIIPGAWSAVGSSFFNGALPGGGIRCWFQDLPAGAEWADPAPGEAPHYTGAKYWRSFAVTARSVPTDGAEAAALVAELFGPTQPEAGSSDGWLRANACFSAGCTPAIAIASEPYLVLLTTVPDTEYSREQLRALAVEVLGELRELPGGTNP